MNYNHEFDVDEWYRELADSQKRCARRERAVLSILGIIAFSLLIGVASTFLCIFD